MSRFLSVLFFTYASFAENSVDFSAEIISTNMASYGDEYYLSELHKGPLTGEIHISDVSRILKDCDNEVEITLTNSGDGFPCILRNTEMKEEELLLSLQTEVMEEVAFTPTFEEMLRMVHMGAGSPGWIITGFYAHSNHQVEIYVVCKFIEVITIDDSAPSADIVTLYSDEVTINTAEGISLPQCKCLGYIVFKAIIPEPYYAKPQMNHGRSAGVECPIFYQNRALFLLRNTDLLLR